MKKLVLVVVVAVICVTGCDSRKEYPKNIQGNFLEACKRNSSPKACKCLLRKIEGKYDLGEFLLMEERIVAGRGKVRDSILEMALECRHGS